ncbi:MAG: hypothetical protein ACREJO_19040 [Phycisphaerales bacterium]
MAKPGPKRLILAFIVAAVSDALSVALALPPLMPAQWVLDVVTAIVLTLVLGFRVELLVAFVMEAIPGVELFPSWLVAVSVIGARASLSSPPAASAPTVRVHEPHARDQQARQLPGQGE